MREIFIPFCVFWMVLFAILALPACLYADVIHTRDGRHLEGEIIEETTEYVKLKMKFGTVTVDRQHIRSIERGGSKEEDFKKRYEKVDRNDTEELFKLAEWCSENGVEKGREQALNRILEIDPGNVRAMKALGYWRDEDGFWHKPGERPTPPEKEPVKEPPSTPEPRPQEYTEEEKAEQARADAALQKYKHMSDAELYELVKVLKGEHRWREVIVVVTEVMTREAHRNNPSFGYTLGRAYAHIGEMELALQICRESLPNVKIDPVFAKVEPAIKILMGTCHHKMGNLKEAIRLGEEAVAQDPSENLHYYNLGKFYLFDRQFAKMQECAQKGRDVSGDRSQFNRLLLAASLALQGKKEEARSLIELTLKRTPASYLAVSMMEFARAYAACADIDKASECMECYFSEYLKYQKKRNELKREIPTDPGFEPVLKAEKFAGLVAIDESADDSKWEFGVVKGGQEKSSDEVKKIQTKRNKKKGRGQLPPVLAPKDWIVIRTRNFDLLSNSLPERLEELAYRLEAMQAKYRQLFAAKDLELPRSTVKMFKNNAEFKAYMREKNLNLEHATAYFSSGDNELVCYDLFSVGMGHRQWGIIYHEACHQFMFAYLGGPHPMWLAEGLACYFETSEYRSGAVVKVGAMNYDRSAKSLQAVRNGTFIPLATFLDMNRSQFYSGDTLLNYAEAWHFIHFLLNRNKSTKKLFVEYLTTLRDTRDPAKARKESFDKVGLDKVERDFKDYILRGR